MNSFSVFSVYLCVYFFFIWTKGVFFSETRLIVWFLSHQRVLVDVRPLHLLGSGPGQRHGTTQHVQILLRQRGQ